MAAVIKPLDTWLAENNVNRRTFYRWVDRGDAPRITKIGRAIFITAADERAWLDRIQAGADAHALVTELAEQLAATVLQLAAVDAPADALRVMDRASAIAHDLIAARARRDREAGDDAGESDQHVARTRLEEMERDAIESALAADRMVKGMGKNPCSTPLA